MEDIKLFELKQFSRTHQSKTLLVTFIYPAAIIYLDSLVQDINAQTTENFVLIAFNDGVKNSSYFFKDLKIPYLVYDVIGFNPMEVRFKGLEALAQTSFTKFIFQDSDDGLSSNRIQTVNQLLDKYALVVNDLDLMDEHGEVFKAKIWEARFKQESHFSAQHLSSYNFAGLGNTSITVNLLDYLPPRPASEIIAVDWYLFYVCLLQSGATGYRTSDCTTKYRQHTYNTIGLQQAKKDEIDEALRLHYLAIDQLGIQVENKNAKFREHRPDDFWWEIYN